MQKKNKKERIENKYNQSNEYGEENTADKWGKVQKILTLKIHVTRPNVEPAVEHVAPYIKSRLQNEILTASVAQEIEEAGNKNRTQKGSGERQ